MRLVPLSGLEKAPRPAPGALQGMALFEWDVCLCVRVYRFVLIAILK